MANGNKTGFSECRFLTDDDFEQVHATFVEAFSDYIVPFALTSEQFRNHINLNAVDLGRSVGCFDGERMVGFSITGFGDLHGKRTAYDAGTGVVPDKRGQGVRTEMFRMMFDSYTRAGIEQFLLEVITSNTGAVNLYTRLGFEPQRELALLQSNEIGEPLEVPEDVIIRPLEGPIDWSYLSRFWDGEPSWQNSIDAVIRNQKIKRIIGAHIGGRCVGYMVTSWDYGRMAQMAVDPAHRGRGIGKALLDEAHAKATAGHPMQIVNIDKSITSAMKFFERQGFSERLVQHEMVRKM